MRHLLAALSILASTALAQPSINAIQNNYSQLASGMPNYAFAPGTIATNVAVYHKLPYDLLKDFQVITLLAQTGVVLVVHPSVKANNLQEFVEMAKKSPGELNFGSAGLGSPQQLQVPPCAQLTRGDS